MYNRTATWMTAATRYNMRKSGEGRSKILTVKMMKTKMVWPGKSRLKRTLPGIACGVLVVSFPDPHLQQGKSPHRAVQGSCIILSYPSGKVPNKLLVALCRYVVIREA